MCACFYREEIHFGGRRSPVVYECWAHHVHPGWQHSATRVQQDRSHVIEWYIPEEVHRVSYRGGKGGISPPFFADWGSIAGNFKYYKGIEITVDLFFSNIFWLLFLFPPSTSKSCMTPWYMYDVRTLIGHVQQLLYCWMLHVTKLNWGTSVVPPPDAYLHSWLFVYLYTRLPFLLVVMVKPVFYLVDLRI